MKKLGLGILIGVVVLVIAGVVIAVVPPNPAEREPAKVIPSEIFIKVPKEAIDSAPAIERVMAGTTSEEDIQDFQSKGCTVIHRLSDATALKCPADVVPTLNVREDRKFYIVDLEADQQINADDVWAQGIDGTGVTVAVLDTGVQANHAELLGSIAGCENFVTGETCEDLNGHGTHVVGIITANGIKKNIVGSNDATGVAPGASVYMLKVCNADGICYESDMMAAMEYAVNTNIGKVMSISIGGGNYSGENCDTDTLAAKVNWVVNNGITVAAAAGNDQFFVSSPACASGAIAVGAVDKNGLMAKWSNFGPSLDIVAPGVSILSSYSCLAPGAEDCAYTWYALMSGTSMSTPMVSGTVALMLGANPSLTVEQIKTALYNTATDINPDSVCYGVVRHKGAVYWIGVVPCSSDNRGAGIVNAYGAYLAIKPTVCEPTTEICDGIDNDCDGSVDEDLTRSCGVTDVGACTFGTETCSAGIWVGCTAIFPTTETCNTIDDDCDGTTDENLTVYSGTDVGECQQGVTECINGSMVETQTEIGPTAEECDGLDNDCDGKVDQITQRCGTTDVGACEYGTRTCTTSVWGECVGAIGPTTEVCNGMDDDCNGVLPLEEVDADADGYMICEGDCNDSNATINPGATEVCDKMDNNCNGVIDEGGVCEIVTIKCWSGTNQYLYKATAQAQKFCKCAQGIYGYSSYKLSTGTKTAWKYVDTSDNTVWNVTSVSSRNPISSVTCTDGKAYPTNQDYYYPK